MEKYILLRRKLRYHDIKKAGLCKSVSRGELYVSKESILFKLVPETHSQVYFDDTLATNKFIIRRISSKA